MNHIPNETFFSPVTQILPDIVVRFDKNLRHLYVSPSVEKVTGKNASEYVGKTNEELGMPKEACQIWRQFLEQVVETKKNLELDFDFEGPSGNHLFHAVACPEINDAGEVEGVFCITRDITSLIERTRELDELTARVAQQRRHIVHLSQMKALADMSVGINHEINNPLSSIMGQVIMMSDKLQDQTLTAHETKTHLDIIQKNSERIARVVDGLRVFTNSKPSDKKTIALDSLVDQTLLLCKEKIQKRGIQLNIDIEPGLLLFGHEPSLMQVIYSLLLNSMEAVENLNEKWINLHVKCFEHEWRLNIIDSGPGIKPEVADKMFHPFFTTKKLAHGLGLGLSIAREIMQEHGGNLFYQNCDGNTQFVVVFPK